MRRRGTLAPAAFTLFLALAALRPAHAGAPANDAKRVAQGKALYADHCSHCHGFGLVNPGNIVPDLREFPASDEERFVDTVTNGKNNRMPPWGDVISTDEIEEIWAYIRSKGTP